MGQILDKLLDQSLPTKTLSSESIHSVHKDHLTYYGGVGDSPSEYYGLLCNLSFSPDVSDIYYERITDAKIKHKTVKISYDSSTMIIHCVVIDCQASPSSFVNPTSYGWVLSQ